MALLHIDKQLSSYFDLFEIPLKRGMDIFVIGYPLFQPLSTSGAIRRPTCTKGVLSTIVTTRDQVPCCVQTSAQVHMGNSGGAIVNEQGQLVGLVTSNTKLLNDRNADAQKTTKLIPTMNFAIPPHALKPLDEFFAGKLDENALQEWADTYDEHIGKIWTLTATLETKKKRQSQFMRLMEKREKQGTVGKDGFLSSRL
jgi:hypothetical protein